MSEKVITWFSGLPTSLFWPLKKKEKSTPSSDFRILALYLFKIPI